MLDKLLYLALKPIELLVVVILSLHLSIFFSDNSLDSLSLLGRRHEEVLWEDHVLVSLLFDEIEQEGSSRVALLQGQELFDRLGCILALKRVLYRLVRMCPLSDLC